VRSLTSDGQLTTGKQPFWTSQRAFVLWVIIPCLLGAVGLAMVAQDISDLQRQVNTVERDLRESRTLLEETRTNLENARTRLLELQAQDLRSDIGEKR
jgi:hypothetical protein